MLRRIVGAGAMVAMIGVGASFSSVEVVPGVEAETAPVQEIKWNFHSEDDINFCLGPCEIGICCWKIPNPS